MLFQQQGVHEVHDDAFPKDDANNVGAPLDLAVQALQRVCAVSLSAVRRGFRKAVT
nr:hypothetical protein [Azospirillum oryzae]